MVSAPVGTKVCPRCSEAKPLEEFASDATKAGGRKSPCRSCDAARAAAYRAAHLDRERARQRLYQRERWAAR